MSLRERLAQREPAREVWWLRIAPVAEVARARVDLEQAEGDLRIAEAVERSAQELAEARERVEGGRAVVAACFEPVEILALDETYEALLREHPPQQDGAAWGPAFGRALFLAGVQGELDREEWVVELGKLSHGERVDAYNLAIAANVRTLDPGLPKGWTTTRS